jgi:hypothetical protein
VAAVNTTTQEETKMAEVKELQVGFRKTVSDGNYGNETHEARLAAAAAQDAASLFVGDEDEDEDEDDDDDDERSF